MTQGYHDRPTQLLPKEDVAVVIWGNKITDDVSSPIRFHASKEEARRYLGNRKKNPWPNEHISKILHITHSQWIFRNFSLHDKRHGYLHKKKVEEIALELESLAGLAPEDVPAESRFLLEINFIDLNKSNVEAQQYWILAINAALTAQRCQLARGARAKRITDKVNRKLPSRTKLGIVAVEQQIRSDQRHFLPCREEHTRFQESNQSSINGFFTKKRLHPAAIVSLLKSNKQLRKPD
jgi:hypothetical protein